MSARSIASDGDLRAAHAEGVELGRTQVATEISTYLRTKFGGGTASIRAQAIAEAIEGKWGKRR